MKWLVGNENSIKRDSFIWNTISAGFSAVQSAVILFFLSRTSGIENAGIVTIGFALATLFMTLGQYGLTAYLVTDVTEKYSFTDYCYTRIFTVFLSLAAAAVFLVSKIIGGSYTYYKATVCFLIILLKMAESFFYVFHSRYQQQGRLDVSARISSIALIVSTCTICLLTVMGLSLVAAISSGIIVYAGLFTFCVKKTFAMVAPQNRKPFSLEKVTELLKTGFPLCVSTGLAIYNGNAPKYQIDACMSEEAQAIFGYIMMPMFVLYLFNSFILAPIMKELAEIWESRDFGRFLRKIRNHCLVLLLFSVLVLAAGYYIGLPVLSWMFVTDLRDQGRAFTIIMLGGTFYTLSSYFGTLLITMRRLKPIMTAEVLMAVLNLILGVKVVGIGGMEGAAWMYVFVNVLAFVIKAVLSVATIFRKKKQS